MGFKEDVQTLTLEEKFYRFLPDTLYHSHYSLAEVYGNEPQEWRKFLRDNHTFIETELAAIAEAEARSALARLGNASGQEVTALKAILEKSKLINDAQKQNTKVVLTFIPSKEEDLDAKPEPEPIANIRLKEEPKDVAERDTRLSSDRPNLPGPEPTSSPIPEEEEKPKPILSKYR